MDSSLSAVENVHSETRSASSRGAGVFLCESLAKHGERCRIWEAERCTASERFALGVGRTRVRDEAEPLHDEALSGGGAIFFVVTWVSRVCGFVTTIAQLPSHRRPQYRDLVRMGVTLPCQSSRLSHYVHSASKSEVWVPVTYGDRRVGGQLRDIILLHTHT